MFSAGRRGIDLSGFYLKNVNPVQAIGVIDSLLMSLYRKVGRFSQVMLTLAPLMVLLVGSCKTSQLPGAYGGNAGPVQFRTALFPDRVNFKGVSYYPAEGYVARARSFVEGDPGVLEMLTEEEIGYLFGKPSMRRQDADARVWQYKTNVCVVDFYFYTEHGKENASTVNYVDVRLKKEMIRDTKIQLGDLPKKSRAKCIKNILDKGDFASTRA